MKVEPGVCARPLPFPRASRAGQGQRADTGWASPVPALWTAAAGSGSPQLLPRSSGGLRALSGPSCRRTDHCLSPASVLVPSPSPRDWAEAPPRHQKPPQVAVPLTEQLRRQREHSPGAQRGARGRSRAQSSPPGRDRPARLRWKREEPRPPPTGETSALAVAPQAPVGFRFRDAP